ncbi:hypothetical protein GBA52_002613 [Prunus armeniaca]|nr:hypothetical protein GBA52_002613 [Prunus armeniaca]
MSFLFKALTYEIDYVVGVEFGEENGKVGKERERKGDRDNEVFSATRRRGVAGNMGWVTKLDGWEGWLRLRGVDEVVVAVVADLGIFEEMSKI